MGKDFAKILPARGVVLVARTQAVGIREIFLFVERAKASLRGHRVQVPETATTAGDHTESVLGHHGLEISVTAKRTWVLRPIVRLKIIGAPPQRPTNPQEIPGHLQTVPDQSDPRVVGVGQAHRKTLHALALIQSRCQNLEVKAEALDRPHRKELSGGIRTESFQTALAIAKGKSDGQPGEIREDLPGEPTHPAITKIHFRIGQLSRPDRYVAIAGFDGGKHGRQGRQIVGAVGIGESDQFMRSRSHARRDSNALPPILGKPNHPHTLARRSHPRRPVGTPIIDHENFDPTIEQRRGTLEDLEGMRQTFRFFKCGHNQ